MELKYPHDNFRSKSNILISKYCPDISLINSKLESNNGNTPLILSLLCNDIKSFSELLSFGASPDIPNNSGESPLHISITKGNIDFLIILLKNNVNCNVQNKDGNTPLHLAVEKKETNMIRILLKNGSDTNIKNNLGFTPTHLAIKNKLNESIMKLFKEKKGDIYNIKDSFNKTGFDYLTDLGDNNYKNIIIKIFGNKDKKREKYGQTLKETKFLNILNEIKNNSQSLNNKKINDKYYFDTLLNNHSEKTQKIYSYNNNTNEFRLNTETNKNEIKLEDLTSSNKEKKIEKKEENKIYTHGRNMICSDLNSNNIQIKELNNSSESDNESNKSKKSLSDFLSEEVNNLDINNHKENKDIVDINNKNINMSKLYSQKSDISNLSKIIENNENNNIALSHSSSRINTYKSDKSNNNQNLYQSNSLIKNKSLIKNIINDTVKKIAVKSISSSEGDSKLNILSKDSDRNFNKNNENELNINTDTNCNIYENGTNSFVIYNNKKSNELNDFLNNKENKSINISNINEEINIITQTNKTDKTNKTNEYIQDNTINRNKTIILPQLNYSNKTNKENNNNQESLIIKKNEMKDNIFLNSGNSHIFSELNISTNNYNNVSLSYSKNLSKNISIEKKNELSGKNINNTNNSNNSRKKRISNGNNPSNNDNSTEIKKSKSFIDSTMKKSNINKSIYNKNEIENFNLKNNDNVNSNIIETNSNRDRIYKKHHRQLSYHINYKSGLNHNNKNNDFKRSNTKDIICNINISQASNKNKLNDVIYQNKNNLAYYSTTKKNSLEYKNKKRMSKEPSMMINKSIKSLASTNNQNITITHNNFANSLTNSNNNNETNIGFNNNKRNKRNYSNKISSRNTLNNTTFTTINKNNRQSKFNTNKNIQNKIKNNNNDEIIYNDYDGDEDEEEEYKLDLKNINTDLLLRLREFLLSCDLLCYFNLMIEKKMYNIDSYINDIQEGIYPLTFDDLEKIGIKKPGHIFRILIKLEIDSGIIDNNLFNFIIEKINYRLYTTTTLAMTSSISDINCCGINICSNDSKYGKRKSGRNPIFNFSDLSSFLRINNLSKFKGNFVYNGFDKIEFVLIQMFSKYKFDQKILNNYLHIYINKDKIRVLNKLDNIKSNIANEFGIETDYNEYNKKKGKITISYISNENKKTIKKNKSYIKEISNSYFSISQSNNNDENYDSSNQKNENQNFCYIF